MNRIIYDLPLPEHKSFRHHAGGVRQYKTRSRSWVALDALTDKERQEAACRASNWWLINSNCMPDTQGANSSAWLTWAEMNDLKTSASKMTEQPPPTPEEVP